MKKIIQCKTAPQPIGPYSQAVEVNGMLYLSGQIPLDSAGHINSSSVVDQTHQVFFNIQSILHEVGYSLEDTFKTTIFLKDMGDFEAVNKVYGEYFTKNFPARSCVEVSQLPKGVLVEIEVIATKGN